MAKIIADYVYFNMVYHLKSCWLTQESLGHDPFSTFCLIWQNSISKENLKKNLNFCLCTPLHPKLFLNDQVGSGPGPH
jgi:hypothetical protein